MSGNKEIQNEMHFPSQLLAACYIFVPPNVRASSLSQLQGVGVGVGVGVSAMGTKLLLALILQA